MTVRSRDPLSAGSPPEDAHPIEWPQELADVVQHGRLAVVRAEDVDARAGPWRDHAARAGAVLDALGYESAVAQGLRSRLGVHGGGEVAPVTSMAQLRNSGHAVFVWLDPLAPVAGPEGAPPRYAAIGLLKVGHKKLFLSGPSGPLRECCPLCVLDFYVRPTHQRCGVGLRLFSAMLQALGAEPQTLAYDRPSPKLRAFLGRHFGLEHPVPQANQFAVFPDLFLHLERLGKRPPAVGLRRSEGEPPAPTYGTPPSSRQPRSAAFPVTQSRTLW